MSHRSFVALFVFALSVILASPAVAKWRIMFLPAEATGVSVTIDGEHVLDWKSTEGESIKDVPAKWATLEKIHVRAESSPNGRSSHIKVYWNTEEECEMEFKQAEECTAAR
jgi:hypothetical protein